MFLMRNFVYDVNTYGWRTAFWNIRFLIATDLIPGNHKHISVRDGEEECEHCG